MSSILSQIPLSQFGWFILDVLLAVSIVAWLVKLLHPLMSKLSHMADDWNGRDGEPSIPVRIKQIEERQDSYDKHMANHMKENEQIRRYVQRKLEKDDD